MFSKLHFDGREVCKALARGVLSVVGLADFGPSSNQNRAVYESYRLGSGWFLLHGFLSLACFPPWEGGLA